MTFLSATKHLLQNINLKIIMKILYIYITAWIATVLLPINEFNATFFNSFYASNHDTIPAILPKTEHVFEHHEQNRDLLAPCLEMFIEEPGEIEGYYVGDAYEFSIVVSKITEIDDIEGIDIVVNIPPGLDLILDPDDDTFIVNEDHTKITWNDIRMDFRDDFKEFIFNAVLNFPTGDPNEYNITGEIAEIGEPANCDFPVEAALELPIYDLSIDLKLISDCKFPDIGDEFQFELEVKNSGNSPVDIATIQMSLFSTAWELVSINGSTPSAPNNDVQFNDIQPFTSKIVSFTMRIISTLNEGEYYALGAQVINSNKDDVDSNPNNYDFVPKEDDEAVLIIPFFDIDLGQPNHIYSCDIGGGVASFDTSGVLETIENGQIDLEVIFFNEDGTEISGGLPNTYISHSQTITVKSVGSSLVCKAFSTDDFQLNNEAKIIDETNTVQLTSDLPGKNGSAWAKMELDLTGDFYIESEMYFGNKDFLGADGIAFVLQPLGVNAGSSGGGIGYEGIAPSLAVEFDTFYNITDPTSVDHVAVIANGKTENIEAHREFTHYSEIPNIEDGKWHKVNFRWTAASKKLIVELDGESVVEDTIDIVEEIFNKNPLVHWGFTASTGGLYNTQRIRVPGYCISQRDVICGSSVDFSLIVNNVPEMTPPIDLEACRINGTASFNLEEQTIHIIGNQNTTFRVDYYNTKDDAENNVNALNGLEPYEASRTKTMYLRYENIESNCFSIGDFQLIVNNVPEMTPPIDLEACRINGTASFNLEEQTIHIIGNQNTTFRVDYYNTEDDAENNVNALNGLEPYEASRTKTMYLRYENIESNCFSIGDFQLIVNNVPEMTPPIDLEACRINGAASFNLEEQTIHIIGNQNTTFRVDYYNTEDDAENNVNALNGLEPYEASRTKTMYLRYENIESNCFSIGDFQLVVHDVPEITPPINLEECLVNEAAMFDLSTQTPTILGNQNPDMFTVSYYDNIEDATTGTSLIISPYRNTINLQTMYVRVENNKTNCYTIGTFQLINTECLKIYNMFSPNGDGTNDFFYVSGILKYPSNKLTIYNRWGTLVYQKTPYDNTWDGTSNSKGVFAKNNNLPVGTYYYILDPGNGSKAKVGWLYLNR